MSESSTTLPAENDIKTPANAIRLEDIAAHLNRKITLYAPIQISTNSIAMTFNAGDTLIIRSLDHESGLISLEVNGIPFNMDVRLMEWPMLTL